MAGRILMIARDVNGIAVQQQQIDGYLNATALAKAYERSTGVRKDVRDWLLTERAKLYIERLSAKTGIPVLALVRVKKGGNSPGTWIHPKLSVPFGTWLSVEFEMLVSEWFEEWMSLWSPSQLEADADRVSMRDELKDNKRLEFTSQIKAFLEAAGRYKPGTYDTSKVFWEAHDKLNTLLTTETAKQMRKRLALALGKEDISEQELLRDYFPITDLANYAALCQAAANEMAINKTHPLKAIDVAARQVLSQKHIAKPINFTERIALVRRRIEQKDQLLLPVG